MENELIEIFCLLKKIKLNLQNVEKQLYNITGKIDLISQNKFELRNTPIKQEDYD